LAVVNDKSSIQQQPLPTHRQHAIKGPTEAPGQLSYADDEVRAGMDEIARSGLDQ